MDDNQRPLRLLSLDGGGIRGLSSLYILKRIMTAVNKKAGSTQKPLYPYEYFDMIGGTSTGGLIAVMLGVLRMDIDSSIREYIAMAPKIFPVEGIFSRSKLGKLMKVATGQQRFDPQPFEIIVKKLIADHLKTRSSDGENTSLGFEASTSQPCKVFVCVTSEKLRKHFRFRSYESSQDVMDDCMIWEACRATAAAPTIFPPIMIGSPSTAYVDGGLGYNNPVRPLVQEATRIWAERNIGCIVSIGTGIPEWKDVGRKIRPLFETLKAISVDTETVAREFQEEMRSRPNIYFRFNVQHGLEQVGLEEWKEFDRTKVATEDYLNVHSENVDLCVSQICEPTDVISWIMRPSQATPSTSNIPFSPDPNFIRRDDIMTKLDSVLNRSGSHNRAALYGLGGIGKSQIAIEYSYLIKVKKPSPWIFWVYASNANRVEQSFRDIAFEVKLPGYDDPKVDILLLVSRWLNDEKNGSWFLILDNADDSEILLRPRSNDADIDANTAHSKRSVMSFIPQKSQGKVLVTSRNRNAAFDLVGNHDNLVKVDPMSLSESLNLLRTKLPIDPAMEGDAVMLLEALERIPLAITQAGAYIRQSEHSMTLAKYLVEFHRNKSNQTALLNKSSKDFRRDETVSNSIIVTWELSFNQISEQHPSSAHLLSLMSMFHRQRIPDFLIREEEDDDDENLAFWDRINPLVNFSLLSVEPGGKFFDMHRLIQMATQTWLEANQSLPNWKAKAIEKMSEAFPDGSFENWKRCELLWPHVEEIIVYEALNKEIKLCHASLLFNTAWYIGKRGNQGSAVQRYEQCLKVRSQFLDAEDHRVLRCMNDLGLIYNLEGRWEEAEELLVQTMEMRKRVLGAEHPSTLVSIASLALTFRHQGRWKEAEELQVNVMNVFKSVFGAEHAETLRSIANLAATISCQGRWKEAEELQVNVMNVDKSVLGAEHPSTLLNIADLAVTISNQGRWKEAEELEMNVMETRKRVLGVEHPETLLSIANLAVVISKQGRWKEAENLHVNVMEVRKRVLGAENPDTLSSMKNLAVTYKMQNRHDEAIALMTNVVSLSTKICGPNHPDTLDSVEWLNGWLEN